MCPAPSDYAARIDEIKTAAAPTLAVVDSGAFTLRDVFVLVECLQQYAEVLDEMEVNPPHYTDESSAVIADRVMELI